MSRGGVYIIGICAASGTPACTSRSVSLVYIIGICTASGTNEIEQFIEHKFTSLGYVLELLEVRFNASKLISKLLNT